MNDQNRKKLRRFFSVTAGALTYGAEQVAILTKRACKSAKTVWDKHENEREKIKAHLVSCKAEFIEFLEQRGKKASDFDKILESLDSLTKEELQKLKEILEKI